jgi:2-polyprenyl-6-methoxyphenol hydroxylase-like FAD-dependent oxidoreductase
MHAIGYNRAMTPRRALIVGGSVGGLFAAHLLRARGWNIAIFERSTGQLADRGASIGTRPDLFAIMKEIGIVLDPSVGVGTTARLCLDRDGRIIAELATQSVNSAWDRIYRPLRAALPDALYQAGRRLAKVEQDSAHVTAIFADGTREAGDLLVAADGIHSTVRGQFLPQVAPRYAGYVAWRGVLEERDLSAAEHKLLFGHMTFGLPEGELILALGMPGRDEDTRPGHRRFYWIWFRPVEERAALPTLCTDASGRCHGSSIPPALVRPEVIRDLHEAAETTLPRPLAVIVPRTAQPYPHGIFDLDIPQMVFGRAVLLGDSAFVARPHVGAGITKAALDAKALVEALEAESDVTAALARYDRERRAFGSALVARSRHLGAYVETGGTGFDRDPATLLREYGAAGIID